MEIVDLLKGAREFLSARARWCPTGSGNAISEKDPSKQTACAYQAIWVTANLPADHPDIAKGLAACALLGDAGRELGVDIIVRMNDGSDPYGKMSEDERYAKVLEIYDKAISKLAAEGSSSQS